VSSDLHEAAGGLLPWPSSAEEVVSARGELDVRWRAKPEQLGLCSLLAPPCATKPITFAVSFLPASSGVRADETLPASPTSPA